MPRVWITDEDAAEAKAILKAGLAGKAVTREQTDAAKALLRHYDTQYRYRLNPSSPEQFHKTAERWDRSDAQDLDKLTPEELLDLQRKMVAAEWKED